MTQLKLFDPFPRSAGSTQSQFSAHWAQVHAAIARDIPQIRHYVQSHRVTEVPLVLGSPLGECWCDGSSETWYDNLADFTTMLEGPGMARLLRDEANFMDLAAARSPILTHEHLLDAARFDPAQHGVKILHFVRRREGTDRAAFVEQWMRADDVATGRDVGATRHVVCTAVDDSYTLGHPDGDVFDPSRRAPYDGVRELWWPDVGALSAGALKNPGAWDRLLHSPVVDVAGSFALCATERIIIA